MNNKENSLIRIMKSLLLPCGVAAFLIGALSGYVSFITLFLLSLCIGILVGCFLVHVRSLNNTVQKLELELQDIKKVQKT